MKDEEQEGVEKDDAQITGRTDGPFGSDDTDVDRRAEDNKHRYDQENSANGTDSLQIRGGQDGRNIRGIGSTDMDSEEGLLRRGDTANSTMEVTEEGMNSAIADSAKTDTAMVSVTTHGPDDYASADEVPVPKAQKAAKEQNDSPEQKPEKTVEERDEEIAETGTDLSNQPSY
jgi:hypothetical protein